MNLLNIIPPEILLEIILILNYKNIIKLSRVDKKMNRLIKAKSILFKRGKIGFPRAEGKAINHNIDMFTNINASDFEQKRSVLRWIIINEIDVVNSDIISGMRYGDIFIYENLKLYRLKKYAIPENFHVITNNSPLDYFDTKLNFYAIGKKNPY